MATVLIHDSYGDVLATMTFDNMDLTEVAEKVNAEVATLSTKHVYVVITFSY